MKDTSILHSPPSVSTFVPAAVVAWAWLGAAAASAAPLAGVFSSSMGEVRLAESPDGSVTGTIVNPRNVCGFPQGTVVFSGARIDDSIAGTLKTCKVSSEGCTGLIDGEAILLISKAGAQLSGTAHFEPGLCKTPLGEAISMRKAGAPRPKAPPKPPDPRGAEVLAKEAQLLLQAGNAEEARKKCHEAVKVNPHFSQGFNCLGVTYYLRERYDEALESYKKALEEDPANRDVYYNIGCVYAVQGKTREALDYLKLALLNGYVDLKTLMSDDDLKNLHGDPAFEKLTAGQID
jgi:tetratricopeptide (TPR) repeat protein